MVVTDRSRYRNIQYKELFAYARNPLLLRAGFVMMGIAVLSYSSVMAEKVSFS